MLLSLLVGIDDAVFYNGLFGEARKVVTPLFALDKLPFRSVLMECAIDGFDANVQVAFCSGWNVS